MGRRVVKGEEIAKLKLRLKCADALEMMRKAHLEMKRYAFLEMTAKPS